MENIKSYIDKNKDRFINELIEMLKIPSVSADSKYKADVVRTAEFVKNSLVEAGADKVENTRSPDCIWRKNY
jgi:acetylornithine deacetylase/succinyl-diaminopimelate desuccinylase-like protein